MISRMTASEIERGEFEEWTLTAARAAEQGQWEQVEECYRKRESAMGRVVLSPDQIERLLAVDRLIEAQACVAKAAVAEQLRQAFATRVRLRGLRSGIGESGGGSGTLRIQA